MALMGFREPNQVKWIGVRPAHRGTQIIAYGSANNAIVILYTVTTGKTLFLSSWSCQISATAVPVACGFYLRDAGDVEATLFLYLNMVSIGQLTETWQDCYPIEIPADYDLVLKTGDPGAIIRGSFHGWEE